MEFIQQQIGLYVLLQALGRSVFLCKDLSCKELLCSFESFELKAEFSEIKDKIRSIELLDVVLVEFGSFLIIVTKGVGSSKVSNDAFVVVSFLICFFVGYCCLFRLVYLDHCIAVYFEVFESRDSLDDLEIALRVSFSALQVLQMNVCEQFSALNIVSRI